MLNLLTRLTLPQLPHIFQHWGDMLTGATFMSVAGYALRTFPPPQNKYAIWMLKVAQVAASNADKLKELTDADDLRRNGEFIELHGAQAAGLLSRSSFKAVDPANPATQAASAGVDGGVQAQTPTDRL